MLIALVTWALNFFHITGLLATWCGYPVVPSDCVCLHSTRNYSKKTEKNVQTYPSLRYQKSAGKPACIYTRHNHVWRLQLSIHQVARRTHHREYKRDQAQAKALLEIADRFLLSQVITTSTRINNILDLFFTNNLSAVQKHRVEKTIFLTRAWSPLKPPTQNQEYKIRVSRQQHQIHSVDSISTAKMWTGKK